MPVSLARQFSQSIRINGFVSLFQHRPGSTGIKLLLSDQAIEGVRGFGEVMRLNQFELPDDPHRDPQRNRDENTDAGENPNSGNQE